MKKNKQRITSLAWLAALLAALLLCEACDFNPIKYELKSFTDYWVTYEFNGASGLLPDKHVVKSGENITIREGSSLFKGDNIFMGWNTAEDGSGDAYAVGDILTVMKSDVTLYAQWAEKEPGTYTVTYNANGASDGKAPAQVTNLAAGTQITVSGANGLCNEDDSGEKIFIGWNTKPDGMGTLYQAGDPLTVEEEDIILYAQWSTEPREPDKYIVTYNLNGATSGTAPSHVTNIAFGDKITLALADGLSRLNVTDPPEFPGWTADFEFTGWNTKADGTGTSYQPGSQSDWIRADTTFYAQWRWTKKATEIRYFAPSADAGTLSYLPPNRTFTMWHYDQKVLYEQGELVLVENSWQDERGNARKNQWPPTIKLESGAGLKKGTQEFAGWKINGAGETLSPGYYDLDPCGLTLYADWVQPPPQVYALGDPGPAGGIVFYDKGFYSDDSGGLYPAWRFLEAAPADLDGTYAWGGAYSEGYPGPVENHCIEETLYKDDWLFDDNYPKFKGKENTAELITHDHGTQYTQTWPGGSLLWGPGTHDAARAADNYVSSTGYDDWFLPSWDELRLLYEQRERVGGFDFDGYYWSSSATNQQQGHNAYGIGFSVGPVPGGGTYKYQSYKVRPVRRF